MIVSKKERHFWKADLEMQIFLLDRCETGNSKSHEQNNGKSLTAMYEFLGRQCVIYGTVELMIRCARIIIIFVNIMFLS